MRLNTSRTSPPSRRPRCCQQPARSPQKGGRQNVQRDQDDHAQDRPPRKGDKGKHKTKGKGKGKQNSWNKRQWDDHANDQWWKKQARQSQWSSSNNWYEADDKSGNASNHGGQQQRQQPQPNKQLKQGGKR